MCANTVIAGCSMHKIVYVGKIWISVEFFFVKFLCVLLYAVGHSLYTDRGFCNMNKHIAKSSIKYIYLISPYTIRQTQLEPGATLESPLCSMD